MTAAAAAGPTYSRILVAGFEFVEGTFLQKSTLLGSLGDGLPTGCSKSLWDWIMSKGRNGKMTEVNITVRGSEKALRNEVTNKAKKSSPPSNYVLLHPVKD